MLYCPYCSAPLIDAAGGQLRCSASGSWFSRRMADRLRAAYTGVPTRDGPSIAGAAPGVWFCPGDAQRLSGTGEDAVCQACGRHLGELIYELVELNPHE